MGLTQITTGGVDDNINIDSNTLKVDGTNNRVGIGTATAGRTLSVDGSIQVSNSTSGFGLGEGFEILHEASGSTYLLNRENAETRFYTNNSERMRVDSSGKIGVGTSSPKEVVDARGAAVFSGDHATSQNAYGTAHGIMLSSTSNLASIKAVSNGSNDVAIRFIPLSSGSGSEAMRIDSSGRLLVGTSSDTTGDTGAKVQIVDTGTPVLALSRNDTSITSGNTIGQIRIFSNDDSGYQECARIAAQADGTFANNDKPTRLVFSTTADGAGSPTERMRIDSSGNVGIGTTSPQQRQHLHIDSTAACVTQYTNSVTGSTANDGLLVGLDSTEDGLFWMKESQNLTFGTSNSERMRIDSSGRVLIGTSSSEAFNGIPSALQIEGTSNATTRMSLFRTSNDASASVLVFGKARNTSHAILSNNDEIGKIEFYGADGNDTNQRAGMIMCAVDGSTSGNDMPGRLVFFTTADNSATPTERWRLTKDGTFTSKTSNIGSVTGTGITLEEDGAGIFARDGANPFFINRISNDGNLIQFYGDNTLEGSIVINGTSVTLSGAHLSRWSQLPSGAARTEILRGSVLSNLDEMCEWGEEDNEQLNRMKVSDVEGDVNVSGVFMAWDDDDETYLNDFYCAMTGDFVIRIAQGTTVARGDLLMSAGDGTAKPQDDDIVRSKTIAKVTSTTVSTTYSDGSYCVPCVLMAC